MTLPFKFHLLESTSRKLGHEVREMGRAVVTGWVKKEPSVVFLINNREASHVIKEQPFLLFVCGN